MSFDMSSASEVPSSEILNKPKQKFNMASAVEVGKQPPEDWQSVLHKAASVLPGAMVRGGAAGATDSAFGPISDVANEFKKGMFDINPQEKLAQNDYAGAAGDFAKDYFSDYRNIAGAEVGADQIVNPLIQSAKGGLGKIGKTASDIFKSGGNLKNVEGQLASNESQMQGLQGARTDAQTGLQNAALDASELAKEKIPAATSDWSPTYGQGLDDAERQITQGGGNLTKTDYLEKVVNPSIKEAEAKGLPVDNPTLSKLYELRDNLSPPAPKMTQQFDWNTVQTRPVAEAPEFDNSLGLNDFKNMKNSVFGEISKGAQRSVASPQPEDVAGNIYLGKHANYVGSASEDMANMNKEYGPAANSRSWGYKVFKPGKSDEVQRGANVLQRIATGTHNADDLNYLKTLEEGSGRFKGTGSLRGETQTFADKIKDIDAQAETLKNQKGNLLQQQSKLQGLKDTRNKLLWGAAEFIGIPTAGIAGLKMLAKHSN